SQRQERGKSVGAGLRFIVVDGDSRYFGRRSGCLFRSGRRIGVLAPYAAGRQHGAYKSVNHDEIIFLSAGLALIPGVLDELLVCAYNAAQSYEERSCTHSACHGDRARTAHGKTSVVAATDLQLQ